MIQALAMQKPFSLIGRHWCKGIDGCWRSKLAVSNLFQKPLLPIWGLGRVDILTASCMQVNSKGVFVQSLDFFGLLVGGSQRPSGPPQCAIMWFTKRQNQWITTAVYISAVSTWKILGQRMHELAGAPAKKSFGCSTSNTFMLPKVAEVGVSHENVGFISPATMVWSI